tara:strand:+ start:25743 stop:26243 length:501 start_codon:yes stop_codon:yes gene_type:complete
MKKSIFLSVIFIISVLISNAQVSSISEFDLYGCWELEKKIRPLNNIVVYKSCEEVANKDVKFGSKISLLAFNESEHESTSHHACFTTFTEKGTWEYDENTRIAILYAGHEWLKEFKKLDPDEYARWGSPEKYDKLKFRVISIENNQLTVEIIPKHYRNIPIEDSSE